MTLGHLPLALTLSYRSRPRLAHKAQLRGSFFFQCGCKVAIFPAATCSPGTSKPASVVQFGIFWMWAILMTRSNTCTQLDKNILSALLPPCIFFVSKPCSYSAIHTDGIAWYFCFLTPMPWPNNSRETMITLGIRTHVSRVAPGPGISEGRSTDWAIALRLNLHSSTSICSGQPSSTNV